MNHKMETYRKKFNQVVLVALMLLFFILCAIFIISKTIQTENEFSLKDFENETMGQAYFAGLNENYQAQIMLYQKILERIPRLQPELALKTGKANYLLGQYIQAMENFDTSLKSGYHDSVEVFFNVALTAHKLNKFTMAEKYYLKTLGHIEYEKEACFNLGNIYFFEYKNELKALEFYQAAIENETVEKAYTDMLIRELKVNTIRKDSTLHNFLKEELETGKMKDFSAFYLPDFVRNKPEKVQAYIHNYIGIIHVNNNNKQNAFNHFQQAIVIDPEFKDARFNFNKLVSSLKN